MDLGDEIVDFLARLASFAETVQRRLGWFLVIAFVLSTLLAIQVFSSQSSIWWNVAKCGAVMLPIAIWGLVWVLLSQIKATPEVISSLAADQDFSLSGLRALAAEPKTGLISLFGTVRELRNNDAFESVTDAIGSVTLLANPLFMILAFAMLAVLVLILLVSPVLLFL